MIKRLILQFLCLLGCGLLISMHALAEVVWVSDQFEIMLRTGPSTNNAIKLMLSSGKQLEVLERDTELGFAKIRTAGGTEGWVHNRYLMSEPPVREQLKILKSQLASANADATSIGLQFNVIKGEYDDTRRQIRALENDNTRLESELAEIKRTAANVLSIDSRNKELQQKLMDAEIRVRVIEQENQEFSNQKSRYWFLSGAMVLLVGIVLGLWIRKIRWQRRSDYDSF
jgi:SH3 domain protein